jgi:hypothetical protein
MNLVPIKFDPFEYILLWTCENCKTCLVSVRFCKDGREVPFMSDAAGANRMILLNGEAAGLGHVDICAHMPAQAD